MKGEARRRSTFSRLFDDGEHRVSYHNVSRSQSYRYKDHDIENASESIAHVSTRERRFSHFSFGRRLWEYVIFVVSILPLWELSFCLLFLTGGPTIRFYIIFIISDVVYAIDIYVILHTAYLSYGVDIRDRHRILRHFGIAWLVVHVFAAIPFSWAVFGTPSLLHYFLLAWPRLLRVHRAIVAADTFNRVLIYDSWAAVLFPRIAVWLLVAHFFSCMFYGIALIEGIENSWVAVAGWSGRSAGVTYVVVLWTVISPMLQNGAGNIVAQTSSEVFLMTWIAITGVSINLYILGALVDRLLQGSDRRFLNLFESFLSFLRFKKLNVNVARSVLHYFEFNWMKTRGNAEPNEVYRFIPETVRNHLKRDMCERVLIGVSIFRMADDELRIHVARVLKFVEFVPGEDIILEGQVVTDLLLLAEGFIDVFMNGTIFAGMVNCADGQFFGEQELLADLPRSSTIRAVTHVSGWRLTREDFQIAIGSRSDMKRQMLDIIKMLFPDFQANAQKFFAPGAVNEAMMQNLSDASASEGGDGAVAMQDSSDEAT
jgi:hypothetical protein